MTPTATVHRNPHPDFNLHLYPYSHVHRDGHFDRDTDQHEHIYLHSDADLYQHSHADLYDDRDNHADPDLHGYRHPTDTPERTCHPVAYPNPSIGGPVHFHCGGGPYKGITLKVFTTSLREICSKPHDCHGQEEEDLNWDLRDNSGYLVSNGLYYVNLQTQKDGIVENHICKVLVLR